MVIGGRPCDLEQHPGGGRWRASLGWLPLALALALSACAQRAGTAAPAPLATSQETIRPVNGSVRLLAGHPPTLDAVAWGSAADAWVAGGGAIYATSDGGARWHRQYAGPETITALDTLGPTHIWAVGSTTLLGTADGGRHWSQLAEPEGDTLKAVDFVSADTGYGLTRSSDPALVATRDGGHSWSAVSVPALPQALCFRSPTQGWVLTAQAGGRDPTVLATTDAGASWRPVLDPTGLRAIAGGSLACGADGPVWLLLNAQPGMNQMAYGVFRSTDGRHFTAVAGGNSAGSALWRTAPRGLPSPVVGYSAQMVATGRDTAFLIGACPVCGHDASVRTARTLDGGQHWQSARVPGPLAQGPQAIAFTGTRNGLLVAATPAGQPEVLGTVDGGTHWRLLWRIPDPVPTTALAFVSSSTGYGLGTWGDPTALLRTRDGGRSWERVGQVPAVNGASYGPLTAAHGDALLAFTDRDHGFAITPAGTLDVTSDGGQRWTPARIGDNYSGLVGVAFADAEHGCIQGTGGLYGTSDGGRTWAALSAGATASIANDAGGGRDQAPLCAQTLAAPRWRQRAIATVLPPQSGTQLGGVWGSTTRAIWFNGSAFGLMITTDGGRNWSRVTYGSVPLGAGLISFINDQEGWLLLAGAPRILRTTDGGRTWIQMA